MDTTYRSDLRALNALSFAEFHAKFEQQFVELDAKVERRIREIERRMDDREAKLKRACWWLVAWASLLIPIIGLWIRG